MESFFEMSDWEASQIVGLDFNFIYIGSRVSALNIEKLKAHGITYVLTVADMIMYKEGELHDNMLKNFIAKVADHPSQLLFHILPACFNFIDECRTNNSKILIHCAAGISRSVSVCLMYVMSRFDMSSNDALKLIRQARPCANPNAGFLHQIRLFEKCNKDISLAEEQFNIQNGGKRGGLFMSVLINTRNAASAFHKMVEDYEANLDSSFNPSKETLQRWLEEIKRLHDIHIVEQSAVEDRVAASITKSALIKYNTVYEKLSTQISLL